MPGLTICQPRVQVPLTSKAYDSWVNADGDTAAEFHRRAKGFLLRFPDQADFEIDLEPVSIRAFPANEESVLAAQTLYRNAIIPLLGNHSGGLNLHGSAVCIGERAVAFMGLSRRGKTTLAGAFARTGHPFLTEDVLSLTHQGGQFMVQPQPPVLRLFPDSAAVLLGPHKGGGASDVKRDVQAGDLIAHCNAAKPLDRIFILGPGTDKDICIRALGSGAAMAQLIQNAFILDVEDKPRLAAHFDRVADLASKIACYELDYPRAYDQLPAVIAAITNLQKG